jgi:peptide/nickel transport system substrate-binding protein
MAARIVVFLSLVLLSVPALSTWSYGPQSAAAAPAAAQCAQRGGTLRVGLDSDLINLDPDASTSRPDRQVWKSVFNTLVGLTANLRIVPELAESWEYRSPTQIVFKLRQGVKFHDGTDFDAEAVKFNIERKKSTPGPRISELASVESVDIVDKFTVRVNLKEPFAPLLAILTDGSGMMSSPTAVRRLGADYARNPVGTGPFRFVEWLKNDHLTVRRFDPYWEQGLPCLDEIRYIPVSDEAVKLTNLKTGALDLIDSVPPKDVASLKQDNRFAYFEVSDLGWRSLDFNVTRPPFDAKAVRQAIAWAVDRNVIVRAMLFGTGVVAQGPISPMHPGYQRAFAPYHRDVEKAKAKLAEAGRAGGFRFPIVVPRFEVREQVAQVLREQLAEIGVQADIQLVDFGDYVARLRTKDYFAQMGGWSGRPDLDGSLHFMFHGRGSQNVTAYDNAKVNEVLDRARVVTDRNIRVRLYQAAQSIIADDAPSIFLFYLPQNEAATSRVTGYASSPDNILRLKTAVLRK